ncbi:MAG: hypothetical protein KDH96_13610 [Candidatus Riesia sp.]|nr:hypothetical protein [Candidatus Riesia sp.]
MKTLILIAFVTVNWTNTGGDPQVSERFLRNKYCSEIEWEESQFGQYMVEEGNFESYELKCEQFIKVERK